MRRVFVTRDGQNHVMKGTYIKHKNSKYELPTQYPLRNITVVKLCFCLAQE